MDRERFDTFIRLFARSGSRRAAVGALVGIALAARSSDAPAEPGKGKAKGRDKGRGRGPGDAPGRLPDGGGDPGDGSTCVAALCPRDPATGRRGVCCAGDWCSCGGVCCSGPDCWVVTTETRGGDSPRRVDREHCQPPDGCVSCAGHEGRCCTACGPLIGGVQECMSSGPIAGGSIRRR